MGNYRISRTNAQKWGTSVNGPILCRPGCLYRFNQNQFCEKDGAQPIGKPCPYEMAIFDLFVEALADGYPLLVERRPEPFAKLAVDAGNICLVSLRISARMNRAWALLEADRAWGSSDAKWRSEFDLCERYWTAMHNRRIANLDATWALVQEVDAEIQDEYWRSKALSSAIGSVTIPEPYRSWAVETMRKCSGDGATGTQPKELSWWEALQASCEQHETASPMRAPERVGHTPSPCERR